ncbi:MAG TPA: NAD(P)/FAD-dependent oxidoreductase [Gemmatales bacterium]|nr:NAD(P)/FAD-dependent oxidoreductase [Gemmatales bacterium]
MPSEHLDVLIIGAGLSGIGAGYHLQKDCPKKTYAILESRDCIGGTWDLFRYPGIRSDSDMYTLGYPFRPWKDGKAIADGPSILNYIRDTAHEFGIDQKIRYQHRVVGASWTSADSLWTIDVERGPSRERIQITCRFLYCCTGYYDYDNGYLPDFLGKERFQGRTVHPQKWTTDIDYAGKRVLVIGSGATAVTLVPEMAKTAAHVTMLQRSPTYIVSMPSQDALANGMRKFLPSKMAHNLSRWKNVMMSMLFYQLSRRSPGLMKKLIRKGVQTELGKSYDLKHFTPNYNPWDQRLCIVPDGDMFQAIKKGTVDIVTDHIETFTEKGVKLKSGTEIEADLIVTATGLKMKLIGGMSLTVDGKLVNPPDCKVYKGMMLSDVPNLAFAIGYTNASWTLKADLSNRYLCRVINYMDQHGYTSCMPKIRGAIKDEPLMDFTSGYVQRDLANLPKQGNKAPWKLYQNYILDLITLGYRSVTDYMVFSRGK